MLMLLGEKETFLIRALEKKLNDSGIKTYFVAANINAINATIKESEMALFYIDGSGNIKPDVLHFLQEKLVEEDKDIILIGEKTDTDAAEKFLTGGVVLNCYTRPLDTDSLIAEVRKHLMGLAEGGGKKSILIVDDDATYIVVIREWLKGKYKVSMANSGMQAIKWLGMNHVDLILLDYEMPVVTGPQVLEMLRSDPETSSIPVIFLTGKGDRASVMQVLALKPEGYLLKTIEKDDLLKELDQFFKKG